MRRDRIAVGMVFHNAADANSHTYPRVDGASVRGHIQPNKELWSILEMAMPAAEIERMIRDAMPDAQVTINDLAGDGDHYAAHVVSKEFEGKSRVQQHQMVYQALQGRMGNELHALALQTSVPE